MEIKEYVISLFHKIYDPYKRVLFLNLLVFDYLMKNLINGKIWIVSLLFDYQETCFDELTEVTVERIGIMNAKIDTINDDVTETCFDKLTEVTVERTDDMNAKIEAINNVVTETCFDKLTEVTVERTDDMNAKIEAINNVVTETCFDKLTEVTVERTGDMNSKIETINNVVTTQTQEYEEPFTTDGPGRRNYVTKFVCCLANYFQDCNEITAFGTFALFYLFFFILISNNKI